MPFADERAPIEARSVMLNEGEALRLKKKHKQCLVRFTAVETDLYYSYSYNNMAFPILPSAEDSLFISPFELVMEPCLELRYEMSDDEVVTPLQYSEAVTNDKQPTQQSDSSTDSDNGTAINITDDLQHSTPHLFAKSRLPREVRVQTQPPAFFNMWYTSLLGFYNNTFGKPE